MIAHTKFYEILTNILQNNKPFLRKTDFKINLITYLFQLFRFKASYWADFDDISTKPIQKYILSIL